MPVRQWAAAGDDLAGWVITNRLELPHAANKLKVADVQASTSQHAADAWAFRLKFELMRHGAVSGCLIVA